MVVPQADTSIVQVTGFVKRYGKHVAVEGVDLTVRPGEIYGLIGPDGAGKSSLMKAIAGVLTYEGGEVNVFGVPVDSERAAERIKHRIGFLPQGLGHNLYPDLSVDENIDFFGRLNLVPDLLLEERKTRWLALTRLAQFRHRAMKHLSGGMKQKLGLVCTLIHEPDLLILDEPTTGVDPVSRRDFWAILSELVQKGSVSALVSTAYMDEAARFHRLSLFYRGNVLASGTPDEIQGLASGSVVVLEAQPQVAALSRLKAAFSQAEAVGPVLRVFVDETNQDEAVAQVRDWLGPIVIKGIKAEEPEPEDAFVAFLRREGLVKETEGFPPASSTGSTDHGSAIEAWSLIRDFGSFRAVDRVSFRVGHGDIFGLLGANGAGKTTVIKMLTGILPPTGGQGRVAGADMRLAAGAIKERIGYMSQAFSLYLDLTVIENIRLFAGIYGLGSRETGERLGWILSMAGLLGFESQLAGRLPMGVRQRLALGCALVHRPRVLFLDEPTSGVDPIGRRRFWDILLRLSREEGVGLLVTTHYMSEAEHCDRLALMHAGTIVAEGSPADMKRQVEREAGRLLELVADQPGVALRELKANGFTDAALFGTHLHILCRDPDQDAERIRRVLASSGLTLRSLTLRPLSLEDVFVHRIITIEKGAPKAPEAAHA